MTAVARGFWRMVVRRCGMCSHLDVGGKQVHADAFYECKCPISFTEPPPDSDYTPAGSMVAGDGNGRRFMKASYGAGCMRLSLLPAAEFTAGKRVCATCAHMGEPAWADGGVLYSCLAQPSPLQGRPSSELGPGWLWSAEDRARGRRAVAPNFGARCRVWQGQES